MRNAFIVSTALLLVGTLGGGFTAYRLATHHEEAAASAERAPAASTTEAAPATTPAGSQPDSASQNPNAAGNAPGDNQPAGNASAAEGATVVAKDGASGQSSTTPAKGLPTEPTSADNPSGKAPAPGSSAAASDSAAGAGDAGAGKLLFTGAKKPEVNCAVCHGAGGKGGVGANLTTADGPKGWDDAQFMTALREGQTPEKALNAVMPRFTEAQLSDGEISDIHAFIKTLP